VRGAVLHASWTCRPSDSYHFRDGPTTNAPRAGDCVPPSKVSEIPKPTRTAQPRRAAHAHGAYAAESQRRPTRAVQESGIAGEEASWRRARESPRGFCARSTVIKDRTCRATTHAQRATSRAHRWTPTCVRKTPPICHLRCGQPPAKPSGGSSKFLEGLPPQRQLRRPPPGRPGATAHAHANAQGPKQVPHFLPRARAGRAHRSPALACPC